MLKQKDILIVVDPYDPMLTEKEMIYLVSVMSEKASTIHIQLLTPKFTLAKKLREYGKVLPPISMSNHQIVKHKLTWQFCLYPLEISMHLRKLTYLAPNFSLLWWTDIKSRIQTNCYRYTRAISLTQGIASYYVADMVQAQEKYMWLHTNSFFSGKWKQIQAQYFLKYDQIFTASLSVRAFYQQHYIEAEPKWVSSANINYKRILDNLIFWQQGLNKRNQRERLFSYQPVISQVDSRKIVSFLKKLKRNQEMVSWVIIGEIENEEKLRRQLKYYQLENLVQFFQPNIYPYSFFLKTDKYVELSKATGMSWATWDAMTLGMPIFHLSAKQEVSWKAWIEMANRECL